MCEKLHDPLTAPWTYLKILNCLLSNKKNSAIPPLLVNGETISNFSRIAVIFNNYIGSQCIPLKNSSSLPMFCLRTDHKWRWYLCNC